MVVQETNMPDLTVGREYASELGWGVELFAAVMLTLIGRYSTMRALKVLGEQFEKATNVWDDALFKAAQGPLSWFILDSWADLGRSRLVMAIWSMVLVQPR